jgi:hypothetical protein
MIVPGNVGYIEIGLYIGDGSNDVRWRETYTIGSPTVRRMTTVGVQDGIASLQRNSDSSRLILIIRRGPVEVLTGGIQRG